MGKKTCADPRKAFAPTAVLLFKPKFNRIIRIENRKKRKEKTMMLYVSSSCDYYRLVLVQLL